MLSKDLKEVRKCAALQYQGQEEANTEARAEVCLGCREQAGPGENDRMWAQRQHTDTESRASSGHWQGFGIYPDRAGRILEGSEQGNDGTSLTGQQGPSWLLCRIKNWGQWGGGTKGTGRDKEESGIHRY